MALICFQNGSLARESIRDQFHLTWQDFGALLHSTPPSNDSGILLYYPQPEITPRVPQPLFVYHGLRPNDCGPCVRAVVESRALAAKLHSEWIQTPITSLRLTGGAATPAIAQVFSDVWGVSVEIISTTNSAALGAALRAYHAHRKLAADPIGWDAVVAPFTHPSAVFQPNPATSHVYVKLLEQYRHVESLHAK